MTTISDTGSSLSAPSRRSALGVAAMPHRSRAGDSSPLKVVYLIDRLYFDLGGTEGQVMKLVRGLHPRVDIELIVLDESDWLREFRQHTDLKITVIPMKGGIRRAAFWRGFSALVAHLKAARADVVHTYFPIGNILGVLAARLAGARLIVSSRRDYGYWMTPGYLFFTRLANRLVDRIVTNSPEVRHFTADKEGFDPARIDVIFNGLDLDGLAIEGRDEALKAELGIPAHHQVVALVANFKPIKRNDTLVRALARVRAVRDDVSVLFIGHRVQPYAGTIERLVEELGLTDRVFYAHAQGDIQRYLSFVDIGCNCSESEGLSNAVTEYMATGVAAVVSDGGGNKDLVRHGSTGLIYPVGDDQALAACLLRLIEDGSERQRMAQAGRAWVRAEMDLPVILDKYEGFYRARLKDVARVAAG